MNQKMAFKNLVTAVGEELKRVYALRGSGKITLWKRRRLDRSETDGWKCDIGRMRGVAVYLDIWCDRFTRPKGRRLYYGLRAWNAKVLNESVRILAYRFGRPTLINGDDLAEDGYVRLKAPMGEKQYGRPVREDYPSSRSHFFGYYDTMPFSAVAGARLQPVVERITSFFAEATDLKERSESPDEGRDYQAIENRKIVQWHLRRERSTYHANLRKQMDDYVCQICRQRMTSIYGVYGERIAEAHHIQPLHLLKKQVVADVAKLITVCPSCHRALHRMSGTDEDVPQLRRLVGRNLRAAMS